MTDGAKIEAVIEFLTERHLECNGGYPYDYRIIGNHLIIAELPADLETRLSVYLLDRLPAWYDRAEAEREEMGEDFDLFEALADTTEAGDEVADA